MRGVRVDPERREVRLLRRHVDVDGARVVDVGIGDGRLSRRSMSRAASIIGVDPTDRYLRRAVGLARRWPDRLRLVLSSGTALPVRSASVDVVLLSWSL